MRKILFFCGLWIEFLFRCKPNDSRDTMEYREPTYESVEIGELIEAVVEADDHYVKSLVFALDDDSPWYSSKENPFGNRIVPSEGIAKELVLLFLERYNPNKVVGLHQKEEVFFHKPVSVGSRISMRGSYTDKYVKRGKGYTVFDSSAYNEDNELLVRQISTEIMRIPDNIELGTGMGKAEGEERVVPYWPEDKTPVNKARADLEPGTPIVPLRKTAYQDQMSVFGGCGKQCHNIHTDDLFAKKAGFKDTLCQGMQTTCWVSQMLSEFFGPSWLTSGWLKTIYLNPVYRGDSVVCHGVVKGSESTGRGIRLNLELWIEKPDGTITSVGWASAIVE